MANAAAPPERRSKMNYRPGWHQPHRLLIPDETKSSIPATIEIIQSIRYLGHNPVPKIVFKFPLSILACCCLYFSSPGLVPAQTDETIFFPAVDSQTTGPLISSATAMETAW